MNANEEKSSKKDDKICVIACVLCLREASKHIEEVDFESSQALLELAGAIATKYSCDQVDIEEMESIKNELEKC